MKTFLSAMMLISVLSSHAQNEDDKTNSINGEDRIFLHGGVKRTYKIYRPKNLPSNAPMVFLLHGQGSSNRWTYITGFNELSEKYGFLAVYPQSHKKEAMLDGALAKQAGMPQHLIPMFEKIAECQKGELFSFMAMDFSCKSNGIGITRVVMWNETNEDSLFDGQSDIAFLTSLGSTLQENFQIDPSKIYVAGFSNGGFMTYSLICQEETIFKAAAVVAGLIDKTTFQNCTQRTTPVIHFHGTEDSMVPIEGKHSEGSPSAKDIVEYFAYLNDSLIIEKTQVNANTQRTIYSPQIGGTEVQYYRIENHDHVWPGRPNTITKIMDNSGLHATELIWEFFAKL